MSKALVADDQDRLLHIWGREGYWQIKIRWMVAPLIVIAVVVARAFGFELPVVPLLVIAGAVLVYNLAFLWLLVRMANERELGYRKLVTSAGMMADYATLLALLHFTGGVSSPLLVFFVFHVIVAAIQFSPAFAYQLAAVGAAGLWLLLLGQSTGWLPATEVTFQGQPVHAMDRPVYLVCLLLVFTVALFVIAAIVVRVMRRLRNLVRDLAHANAAIERLGRDRTHFMLQTAHNLRAPLGASLSLLQLVEDGDQGPVTEKQKQTLERIATRLGGLNQMIGEILTIARARDRSVEIADVVVDVEDLAECTEALFREQANGKHIEFVVSADENLPKVDSGVHLLSQMMENLVSNAIKYTPEGGKVVVRFENLVPSEVHITVADTGIGIPADEQAKLFTEFFRASNAKKTTSDGTGLGLALVKKTVERLDGRIRVESAVGEGTTIVIDLPVHAPRAGRGGSRLGVRVAGDCDTDS